jgi:hypothetical protein
MRRSALLLILGLVALATAAPAADKWSPPEVRKIAAGLHEGHLIAPRIRRDGRLL